MLVTNFYACLAEPDLLGQPWACFGGPPGLAGGPAGGPASWPTRTGACGPAYGAPGQGLVASVLTHQDRLVASVGLVPGSSLAMSEACVWACQGGVVSTCSYVH